MTGLEQGLLRLATDMQYGTSIGGLDDWSSRGGRPPPPSPALGDLACTERAVVIGGGDNARLRDTSFDLAKDGERLMTSEGGDEFSTRDGVV